MKLKNIAIIIALISLWLVVNKALAFNLESELEDALSKAKYPIIVELYTSQGCSSCPPADAIISKLAEKYKGKILPLSFHVDYWNYIGWEDPFSSQQATYRQKLYSAATFNNGRIYTPQAIINGADEVVGSNYSRLLSSIVNQLKNRPKSAKIDVVQQQENLVIKIDEYQEIADINASITLIEYTPKQTTKVNAGENRGATITNHNVVKSISKLGDWRGEAKEFTIQKPKSANFVIILQQKPMGGILGAKTFSWQN